jgi:hypothetical protein
MRGVFMANNIVQHRRGTTEEWKKLDLVPSEGELVIEECADGTCKCKIGNGISKFSELAYLSDPLNARAIDLLTEQHQEDIISIVDKLTKLKDELKTDLKCLETNTETRINALFVDELRLNVNTLISNVEQLENTVEAAKTVSTDKFKKLEEDLVELHNIVLELPVDSSINESIENASQEVLTQVDEKIKAESEKQVAIASKTHASLESDIFDLKVTLGELNSAVSVQLVKIYQDLNDLLDARISATIPKLSTQLAKLEDELDEQEAKLLFKIQETYSKIDENYGPRILSMQSTLAEMKGDFEKSFSEFIQKAKEFEHSISKRCQTVETKIETADELYRDAMNALNKVRNENSTWHVALNSSINTINDSLTKISQEQDALETDINALTATFMSAHTTVQEKINSVQNELDQHLTAHEIITDITSDDINTWRKTSEDFVNSSRKALYVSDDNKLCANMELSEAVVLDCGTA